jgi:hypothetical protein
MSSSEFMALIKTKKAFLDKANARSMRGFGIEAKPQWKRRGRACDC